MDHLFPAQPPPPIPTQQAQTQAGVMVANQFNDFLAPAIPTSISAFNLAAGLFQPNNSGQNFVYNCNIPSASASNGYAPQQAIFQQQAPQQQQSQRNQIITISMQYGSHKELVIVERSNDPQLFQFFRQKARQMVERQLQSAASSANGNYAEGVAASPSSSTTSFFQSQQQYQPPAMAALPPSFSVPIAELQLFMHDYRSPNMLEHLTNLAQLDNGSIVEIIRIDRRNEHPTRLHCLGVNSYKTPTFCDYCEDLNQTAKLPSPPAVNATIPQFQLPHTLSMHNYKTPTVCKVCDKMLLGLIKQGMKCRDCKVNVHKKCAVLLPMNCQITADNAITPHFDQMSVSCEINGAMPPGTTTLTSRGSVDQESLDSNAQDAMIPLARLPGSASSRGANRQGPLCEGWMIHFLLQPASSQPQGLEERRRLRHYWILANGAISMYNEYNDGVNPHRVYKQIQLAEIIALIPYEGPALDSRYPPHCFEIRTTSNLTYCVGENLETLSGAPPTKLPRHYGPSGSTSWHAWFQALQQSLQPPPSRTDPSNVEPALQFSQLYQVLREKVLGSGQFGTVYGGIHRQSGREVAVKVIAKDRFSKKSNAGVETLKSEVAILQAVDHQGIIKLESMFETKDKIFVVMEKMNGDMLEMILSQATGRLNERSTKFLIMQILSALRYLHSRGIAHCDLKPENVLLSDFHSNFPQTKLCDFGYARFIGDAQFRKTIVGTPAYLAPEVLKKKGYNKSLDMWSVGVIIYVTLSGTFPFNDGEEIAEQIQNAAFMFPTDPWKQISPTAIELIQSLLKVQIEQRLTIEECIVQEWLQDAEVYADLLKLEQRLGVPRYLTSEQDDLRFGTELQRLGVGALI